MKKVLVLLLYMVLMMTLVISCATPPVETPGAVVSENPGATETKSEVVATKKIGIVACSATLFYNLIDSGIMDTLESEGYTFQRGVTEFNIAKELSTVENFLLQGVDAIFLTIADAEGSAEAIMRCNEAGVPVFCTDSTPLGSGKFVTVCQSNNVEAGRVSAQAVIDKMGGKGKIAIIDGPQVTVVLDRMKGFKEVIAKYPDVELVSTVMTSEHSVAGNMATIEDVLQANPDINAILGYCAYLVMASEMATQNVGRTDVIFGGVDGMPEECDIIANGVVDAVTIGQQPYEMGVLAAKEFLKYVKDKNADIPLHVDVPIVLITKENAAKYDAYDIKRVRADI